MYLGLYFVSMKFVKEFISLNSSRKDDFDASYEYTVHVDE